jgi:hypothetical protein
MFDDLYDTISFLWSWRWPTVDGEVTAVDVELVKDGYRLSVAYQFSIRGDGPYTGESIWAPSISRNSRVRAAADKIHVRDPVLVRYRLDDPSVNRLDSTFWRGL